WRSRGYCDCGHRWSPAEREIDENRAGEIERGKEIEVTGEPEVIDERGRHEASEEVARDIPRDIRREGAGGIGGAATFGQIRQRQRERRRHAQPLRDAQQGKCREVGRDGKQGGRERE